MLYYLPDGSTAQLRDTQPYVVQIGRWNTGSLLLHKNSAPDVANLLVVVDARCYGMMELAGCALCLWAIPWLPHEDTDDPFAPFYVPTHDLLFPHDKGLVIRCRKHFARSDGASVILPIGAAGYTATAGPGNVEERSGPSGRECTSAVENNSLHCGCPAVCIPEAGR